MTETASLPGGAERASARSPSLGTSFEGCPQGRKSPGRAGQGTSGWFDLVGGHGGHGLPPRSRLKLSKTVAVVNPASGKTVASSGPKAVVELPPKSLTVPGMNPPPSCQAQAPGPLCVVEKNG